MKSYMITYEDSANKNQVHNEISMSDTKKQAIQKILDRSGASEKPINISARLIGLYQ